MIKRSSHDFAETVARLSDAIVTGGNTIFATIDQAQAASGVGLTLRPTTLIVFGNPRGGTPLMDAFPLAALELPLKFLVWEENGATSVAWVPMSEIAARHHITGMDQRIAAMDAAQIALSSSV